MPQLTVFTPTYNRAYCLNTCYEGLIRQTSKDFIWLIIDDGSADHTKELVENWMAEDKIAIHYYYQKNQGMHGAHNTAYELIDTELNICIDSDDYMPDDAVEKILSFWKINGSRSVGGIIGLDSYTDGKIIGTKFPENLKTSTLFDLYNQHRVTGDKKMVFRTELTRKFPYPIFKDEKYVGLDYKYHLLGLEYEMLLMNKTICCVEYLPDGSSKNMLHQYRKNPKGFIFYRKELMKMPLGNTMFKFRQAVHYVSSSFFLKERKILGDSPKKLLTMFALPVGLLLHSYIRFNTTRKNSH